MPRYFFQHRNGARMPEAVGLDFEGPEAARREAIESLFDIVKGTVPENDLQEWVIDVHDEAGQPIFEATLAITVKRKR